MKDDKGSGKRDRQGETRKREEPRAASGTVPRAADAEGYVGSALRSAYQETVDEGVPDELMNLLNRLD